MPIKNKAAALVLALGLPAFGGVQYTITDLGTLGGTYSRPYAINNHGEVVGVAKTTGDATSYGFIWRAGAMTPLASWASSSTALDINDNGQIVGAVAEGNVLWAFTYEAGVIHNLGSRMAQGINSTGTAVGYSETAPPNSRTQACYWSEGRMCPLNLPENVHSEAYAINDYGDIVGGSQRPGEYGHAFLYSNGAALDLGTLGGLYSEAHDINENGQIVGVSPTALSAGASHAFLWQNGTMTDLGTLSGQQQCHTLGYAINSLGQVVGLSKWETDLDPLGLDRACLWDHGEVFDLNDLIDPASGWALREATDINDMGQIVGRGVNPDGSQHAFLLTPIPEPASGLLLLVGGLTFMRRRPC